MYSVLTQLYFNHNLACSHPHNCKTQIERTSQLYILPNKSSRRRVPHEVAPSICIIRYKKKTNTYVQYIFIFSTYTTRHLNRANHIYVLIVYVKHLCCFQSSPVLCIFYLIIFIYKYF